MASLDQENIYAPKRTISGNIPDNARIMGHASVDIHTLGTGNQIPGTGSPNRGAAIYCGQAYTSLTVILEGDVGEVDALGNQKTTTFKGIAAGSFLPILAVQVQSHAPSLAGVGELVALL